MMKLKTSILTLLCAWSLILVGQDTTYYFTYGGTNHDHCKDIQATSDGGYILVGASSSFGHGSSDVYLVKIDSTCNYQWSKAIGGSEVEWGYSVKQTFDKGYIIVGYTNSLGAGGYDVYLVKTDSLGDTLWTKTYGGLDWDFGYSVQQTPDSGFVVCGETYSFGYGTNDVYVIRTDKTGDTIWTKTFGGIGNDIGYSIIISNDANFVIVGETSSFGLDSSDVYLLKVDQNGDSIWTNKIGGSGDDVGYEIEKTTDNGYVIYGTTSSFTSTTKDTYLVKADSLGKFLWSELHWVQSPQNIYPDEGRAVKELINGGFIVLGYTESFGNVGVKDFFAMRTDVNGFWQAGATYGGLETDQGFSIAFTSSGGYIFAGTTQSYGAGLNDMMIIKTDSLQGSWPVSITNFTDSLPVIVVPAQINSLTPNASVKVFPNPFSIYTTIYLSDENLNNTSVDFSLMDVFGRNIMQLNGITSNEFMIDRGNLSTGIYLFTIIQSGSLISRGKLIIR